MFSSVELREEKEWGVGENGSKGRLQRVCGAFKGRRGRGVGCTSMVAIGREWRCLWHGVVSLVQWCDHKVRARAVPTARRTFSVVVQHFRDTARRFRWASVLGEGGTSLGLRCRAGRRVLREERACARLGMAMPLSASRSCTGVGRAWARGRPTDGMGGSRRLGVDDGGWGLLVA
jgi:hypothetical protein